ncbi:hypothetical protein LEMLEM_LOCUS20114 [Lemmus lemmus]
MLDPHKMAASFHLSSGKEQRPREPDWSESSCKELTTAGSSLLFQRHIPCPIHRALRPSQSKEGIEVSQEMLTTSTQQTTSQNPGVENRTKAEHHVVGSRVPPASLFTLQTALSCPLPAPLIHLLCLVLTCGRPTQCPPVSTLPIQCPPASTLPTGDPQPPLCPSSAPQPPPYPPSAPQPAPCPPSAPQPPPCPLSAPSLYPAHLVPPSLHPAHSVPSSLYSAYPVPPSLYLAHLVPLQPLLTRCPPASTLPTWCPQPPPCPPGAPMASTVVCSFVIETSS